MRLARAYERRNEPQQLALPAPSARPGRRVFTAATASPSVSAVVPTTSGPSTRAFKKLSPEEMAERRKQGLCYNCDEQYVRGHKCARLFYLEASDYIVEEPEDSEESGQSTTATAEPPPINTEAPRISLNAITGIRTATTMQLYVQVGNTQLVALLDSGSTHNFVRADITRRIGLHFQPCPGASVLVANGDRVACSGLATEVAIRIADETFTVDCYSIPLDGYDMVLGIKFLRTLGPILWDFDDLCLAFTRAGQRVFWRGIGSTRYDVQSMRLHAVQPDGPALLQNLL